jgi:hypothetical protein
LSQTNMVVSGGGIGKPSLEKFKSAQHTNEREVVDQRNIMPSKNDINYKKNLYSAMTTRVIKQ